MFRVSLLHGRGMGRALLTARRKLTTTAVAAAATGEPTQTGARVVVENGKEYHIDVFGRRFLKNEQAKVPFYYDEDTFDSCEQIVTNAAKPQYATSWSDARFPSTVQFMDSSGKRPYYVDMANPITMVTWAPPGDPDLDIFKKEYEEANRPFMSIPTSVPGARFTRRGLAALCDFGVSLGVGTVFGALVFVDLGKLMEAGQAMGFSSLIAFLARDAMNLRERGTRSLGKQWMKLEIVKSDGTLPTRWSTALRQATIPLYILGPQLFFPQFILLPIVEVGLLLFTQRRLRLGDVLARTSVVEEQPDRKERFAEKCKREDEDDAKD